MRHRGEWVSPCGTLPDMDAIDVTRQPALLVGKTLPSLLEELTWDSSWRVEELGEGIHRGQGWLLRQYYESGVATGRMIRWHPQGGATVEELTGA